MAEKPIYIDELDWLDEGREKINRFAIEPAYRAEINSEESLEFSAEAKANSEAALAKADETDIRLDHVLASEMENGEVIDARRDEFGHDYVTLKKRLDAENRVKTVMDFISGTYHLVPDTIVHTQGFYEVADSGAIIYDYLVKSVDINDVWVDTLKGFFISEKMELRTADSSFKLVPLVGNELNVGMSGVTGVNDDIVFQIVINYCVKNLTNLRLNKSVNVVNTIDIKRSGRDRTLININGSGELSKYTSGFLFTNSVDRTGGNLRFVGIKFRSNQGAGTKLIDGGNMLRIYFDECDILNVDNILSATGFGSQEYAQTVYLNSCKIIGGKGQAIAIKTGYDISIIHCVVEHRDAFFYCGLYDSIRILDNLIEGLDGRVFEGISGRNLSIENNYLEACSRVGDKPYFEFSNETMDINSRNSISLRNNLLVGTKDQSESNEFSMVKFKVLPRSINVSGNFSDCNLYRVDNAYSVNLNTSFLEMAYRENVTGNKEVITGRKKPVGDIQRGTGTLFGPIMSAPFTLAPFNALQSAVGDVALNTINGEWLAIQALKDGIQTLGVVTKESAHFSKDVDYVFGMSIMPRMAGQGDAIFRLLDSNLSTVYSDRVNIQSSGNIANYPVFYSMKPFKLATSGKYYVSVQVAGADGGLKTGNGLYIENMVMQRGIIAQPFVTSK